MTVRELIEALNHVNSDLIVVTKDCNDFIDTEIEFKGDCVLSNDNSVVCKTNKCMLTYKEIKEKCLRCCLIETQLGY